MLVCSTDTMVLNPAEAVYVAEGYKALVLCVHEADAAVCWLRVPGKPHDAY